MKRCIKVVFCDGEFFLPEQITLLKCYITRPLISYPPPKDEICGLFNILFNMQLLTKITKSFLRTPSPQSSIGLNHSLKRDF